MKLHEKIYYCRKKSGLSQDALAEQLLEGRFQAGDTIAVDCENGIFTFTTAPPSRQEPAKA